MRSYLPLILSLILAPAIGCTDKSSGDTAGLGDDTAASGGDTAGTSDDTANPDAPEDPRPDPEWGVWTEGPALPACEDHDEDSTKVALSGIILTPEGAEGGYVVYDKQTGTIACVGPECETANSSIVCTGGVISPGLIDTHNHLQYNVLAPWQHGKVFDDRYDWRGDDDYYDYRDAYDAIRNSHTCEIGKWAELRVLVGGGTAAVGTYGGSCLDTLVRNLDEGWNGHQIDGFSLDYSAGTVTDSYDADDGTSTTASLNNGSLEAELNHVAEGRDGNVRNEIDHMFDVGMVGPGQVFVHASDATTEQLARMATTGTAISWAPRSNLDLYSMTTPADIAMRMGVAVALGPDWTLSGSINPAREMSCAAHYLASRDSELSDRDIWALSTHEAARVLGLDGIMGTLEDGFKADISVFSFSDYPFFSAIESRPQDVRLVIVDGQALYGRTAMVERLHANPERCEELDACGAQRTVCVATTDSGDNAQTMEDLETSLSAGLGAVSMPSELAYAGELFGLFSCEETRASCDISSPTDGDSDGDGVEDGEDLCPSAYDPNQWDHDSDGVGDVCDSCPLAADLETCAHDPADIDGDGIANDEDACPYLYDTGADSDGDGLGDGCDPCPDDFSASGACPTSISSIRDPGHPDPVAEGSRVLLSGVIVTAVVEGTGFTIQDPDLASYAGIYVYDGGANTVTMGDVIDLEGDVQEYYGLTELTDAVATVTDTAALPPFIVLSDACQIGTGGAQAEALESMLVRITDVSVTNDNPDAPEDYEEFEVASCLRIDDWICEDCWGGTQPAVGTTFSTLQGVLTYTWSNTKLAPRTAADMVVTE